MSPTRQGPLGGSLGGGGSIRRLLALDHVEHVDAAGGPDGSVGGRPPDCGVWVRDGAAARLQPDDSGSRQSSFASASVMSLPSVEDFCTRLSKNSMIGFDARTTGVVRGRGDAATGDAAAVPPARVVGMRACADTATTRRRSEESLAISANEEEGGYRRWVQDGGRDALQSEGCRPPLVRRGIGPAWRESVLRRSMGR